MVHLCDRRLLHKIQEMAVYKLFFEERLPSEVTNLRARCVREDEPVAVVVEEGGERAPLGPEHVAHRGRASGVRVEELRRVAQRVLM